MGIVKNVPDGTVRASLIIRHTHSVQDGPNETRTLEQAGVDLVSEVDAFYATLLLELAQLFGPAEFWCSKLIRSALTAWELFHPEHLNQTELLDNVASIKKIRGGAWRKEQKAAGKTTAEMILMVVQDPSLREGQPFDQGTENFRRFAQEGSGLRIGVAHEPHIATAAEGYLQDNELGCDECQGVIFYIDAQGEIIGAEKIVPPATVG